MSTQQSNTIIIRQDKSKAKMTSNYDPTRTYFDPNIPQILPHENMYKIQIGSTLFKISGASLSSDGPSYFTDFFTKLENENNENNTTDAQDGSIKNSMTCQKTLFIDRSAEIFKYIYQHLQGYYIDIKDEVQYTMLIADSMYYNLPRLRKILKDSEYYYTKIGEVSFKLPKSIFDRDGDTYNYFYLTSDTLYVDIERVIISRKLIRPPPHSYSFVPRSPHLFKQLFELLCGATLTLDDNERNSLITECRYYRLLNLEQKLIKCKIIDDSVTNRNEIWIKLKDISKNGLSISNHSEDDSNDTSEEIQDENDDHIHKKIKLANNHVLTYETIMYKRPYVETVSRVLTIQIDDGISFIDVFKAKIMIGGKSKQKFETLFKSMLQKRLSIEIDNYSILDKGLPFLSLSMTNLFNGEFLLDGHPCKFEDVMAIPIEKLRIKRSMWQIILHGEVSLVPIKLDIYSTMSDLRKNEDYL